jgi:hypothetical protein
VNLHTKVFKAALKDEAFVADIRATGDPVPSKYTLDEVKKAVYGSSYIGWLMGRHGAIKGKEIYDRIKYS